MDAAPRSGRLRSPLDSGARSRQEEPTTSSRGVRFQDPDGVHRTPKIGEVDGRGPTSLRPPAFHVRILCFDTYLRLHLHLLKSRRQKPGVRSQNRRTSRGGFSTSDFGPRTSGRLFCFQQHLRLHLHLLKSRSQKPGVRSQNRRTSRGVFSTSDFGPRTSDRLFCFQ